MRPVIEQQGGVVFLNMEKFLREAELRSLHAANVQLTGPQFRNLLAYIRGIQKELKGLQDAALSSEVSQVTELNAFIKQQVEARLQMIVPDDWKKAYEDIGQRVHKAEQECERLRKHIKFIGGTV